MHNLVHTQTTLSVCVSLPTCNQQIQLQQLHLITIDNEIILYYKDNNNKRHAYTRETKH